MKKWLVCLVVLVLGTAPAWAKNGWGIFGASWDTQDASRGWGIGLKIAVEMVPEVELEIRSAFFDDLSEIGGDVATDLEVVPLEAGLALHLPMGKNLTAFGGGGLGYYFIDGDLVVLETGEVNSNPDDEIGFYAVSGVEFVVSDNATLFGEAKYTWLEIDSVNAQGNDGEGKFSGLDLDGLGLHVGIMIRW